MRSVFSIHSLSRCVLIFSAALLGTPQVAFAETILPNPQFAERASCVRGPSIEGTDLGLPEVIALDFSSSAGQSCISSVAASAFGPLGDVQVNSQGSINDALGSVFITYWFAVDSLVADAPDTPVSVTTTIAASATIQGSPVAGGNASALFQVVIPDPLGPNGDRTYRGTANVCGPDLGVGCPDDVPSVELSLTVVLMLPPNTALLVDKQAAAGALAGGIEASVGAQAVVDPIFVITPGFMVDYNGVPTAATDLYRINYSAGITTVPAPAAGWLALTAFSLLGLRARRTRRAS